MLQLNKSKLVPEKINKQYRQSVGVRRGVGEGEMGGRITFP